VAFQAGVKQSMLYCVHRSNAAAVSCRFVSGHFLSTFFAFNVHVHYICHCHLCFGVKPVRMVVQLVVHSLWYSF